MTNPCGFETGADVNQTQMFCMLTYNSMTCAGLMIPLLGVIVIAIILKFILSL